MRNRETDQEINVYREPNFESAAETLEEIQRVATEQLENTRELFRIMQHLANGADPIEALDKLYKQEGADWFYPFAGLVERVENAIGAIQEYADDLKTQLPPE